MSELYSGEKDENHPDVKRQLEEFEKCELIKAQQARTADFINQRPDRSS